MPTTARTGPNPMELPITPGRVAPASAAAARHGPGGFAAALQAQVGEDDSPGMAEAAGDDPKAGVRAGAPDAASAGTLDGGALIAALAHARGALEQGPSASRKAARTDEHGTLDAGGTGRAGLTPATVDGPTAQGSPGASPTTPGPAIAGDTPNAGLAPSDPSAAVPLHPGTGVSSVPVTGTGPTSDAPAGLSPTARVTPAADGTAEPLQSAVGPGLAPATPPDETPKVVAPPGGAAASVGGASSPAPVTSSVPFQADDHVRGQANPASTIASSSGADDATGAQPGPVAHGPGAPGAPEPGSRTVRPTAPEATAAVNAAGAAGRAAGETAGPASLGPAPAAAGPAAMANAVGSAAQRTASPRQEGVARTGTRTNESGAGGAVGTAGDPAAGRPLTDGLPSLSGAAATQSGASAGSSAAPDLALAAAERSAAGEVRETLTEAAPAADASALGEPLDLTADRAEFGGELAERVSMAIDRGLGRAQVDVRPEGMGPIRIEISLQGSEAHVQFHAPHADTRHLLAESGDTLRQMLAERGIQLGSSQIGDPSGGAFSGSPSGQDQRWAGRDERRDESAQPIDVGPLRHGPARGNVDLFV